MTQKEFNEKLKALELSLDDFANLTNLPVGTVYGWNRQDKTPPKWLSSWFENYEKAKSYEYIKEKVLQIENIKQNQNDD